MIKIIYWTEKGLPLRDKICEYFNIPKSMTVNGETLADINETMLEKLQETENDNGFSLSKDGKMVSFNIIAGYLNSESINGKDIVVNENDNATINKEDMVEDECLDEK